VKVLVLNSGSSSIKYELRDSEIGYVLKSGVIERIGEEGGPSDHGQALESILQALVSGEGAGAGAGVGGGNGGAGHRGVVAGALKDLSEIDAVGHRVVHGGSHFSGPALLTTEVIQEIEECAPLAPLHNPPALLGIREALRVLPNTPQVAVFDTAFHATIPPQAHVYALPYEYYERHGVRRYGFHGISLQSVTRSADAMLGGGLAGLKVVIAHLGNGASVTAVDQGRSVDTSMGLTPLEGLVMGTRAGDIDPGVLLYLMRELGLTVDELDRVLNQECGLLGVSGVSNDMRDVLGAAAAGDLRSRLALDIYCYRLRKYIGAYAAAMGGLDVLVFTAGIGENSADIRAAACNGLGFLGVELDEAKNAQARGVQSDISAGSSRVRVLVVPTDEERVIAEETAAVVGRQDWHPSR
jgi:acetate kinase